MTKDAIIGIRLEGSIKRAAAHAAAMEHRSMSALLEKLLFEHLVSTGYLLPDDPEQIEWQSKAS